MLTHTVRCERRAKLNRAIGTFTAVELMHLSSMGDSRVEIYDSVAIARPCEEFGTPRSRLILVGQAA
jgi:hypothetical protein